MMLVFACTDPVDVQHAFYPMFSTPRNVCVCVCVCVCVWSVLSGSTLEKTFLHPACIPGDQTTTA